jgi:aryl-alcohol dehydrogenase-like predicted oxidoreductase
MQYSLLVRDIEREHVPLCRRHGVGILPWSPLAGGFLTGKFRRDQPPPSGTRLEVRQQVAEKATERNWRIVEELIAVAAELESTPSRVAVAWLLRKPAVTSVIFGARTMAQLEDNLKAAELKIPDAAQARLDAVSALDLGYPYEFIHRVQKDW